MTTKYSYAKTITLSLSEHTFNWEVKIWNSDIGYLKKFFEIADPNMFLVATLV
jgi:hypothetical protein